MSNFLLMYKSPDHVWFTKPLWDIRPSAESTARSISDSDPTMYESFDSPHIEPTNRTRITVLSKEEAHKHPDWRASKMHYVWREL
jgi:hypothetical protein